MHDRSAGPRAWKRVIRLHDAHPAVSALILSTILSGWVYWSLVSHLRSATPADPDTALFIWSMQHAPHRLLHLQNPFYSSAIFATSGGANLAFNATAPLLGLLMYPVTAVLGPVAGLNVLTVLTPVLNTLAARRLLRIIAGVSGLSVTIGAALVGFSPLVMMHNGARLQLVFQPLALLLLAELWILGRDRRAGRPPDWRHVVAAGALAGAQLWIGSEQLAIVAIIAAVGVAVALVLDRRSGFRRHLAVARRDLAMLGTGFGVMAVVASPFLIAYLFGSERYTGGYHVPARPLFGLRLANLFTPTDVTLLHSHLPFAVDRVQMSVFRDEDTGYVGLLAVAAVLAVVYTWRRRTLVQRGAVLVGGSCWLLALGPTLRWSGTGSGLAGPWRLVERLPVLQEIVANRLSMAMFLALGVLVASAGQNAGVVEGAHDLVRERTVRAVCWCLPILLIPGPARPPTVVSSAADQALERLCRGALVVTMPQHLEQDAMAWQARSDFAFNLARGFAFRASTLPKGERMLMDDIAENGPSSDTAGTNAIDELRSHGITCVLTPASSADTLANLEPVLGPPTVAGDVAIWARP